MTDNSSGGIWGWINSILSGAGHILGTIISKYFPVLSFSLHNLLAELHALAYVFRRVIVWLLTGYLKRIWQEIVYGLRLAQAYADKKFRQARQLIYAALAISIGYTVQRVTLERKRRELADARLDAEIKTRIKWLHQAIEREAVSGYREALSSRKSGISRLGDIILNNNPIVRTLVKRIVTIALDLVEVDNPILRITVGFLLKHLIDRLGIDRIAAHLFNDLVGALTGRKRPQGLADVISDLSARCQTSEDAWSRFMDNGGPQVEQAGTEWKKITHFTADAALLAFFGLAIAAPQTWARDVNGTIGHIVNRAIIDVADLLKRA